VLTDNVLGIRDFEKKYRKGYWTFELTDLTLRYSSMHLVSLNMLRIMELWWKASRIFNPTIGRIWVGQLHVWNTIRPGERGTGTIYVLNGGLNGYQSRFFLI